MRLTKQCWIVLLTMSLLMAIATLAQQPAGLVNVNISDVRAEIAKNTIVDVSQIPVNVEVPTDVAAKVCGIAENVLASQVQQGSASCRAKSTSPALNSAVQDEVKKTKQGPR